MTEKLRRTLRIRGRGHDGPEFYLDPVQRKRLLNALQYGDATAERSNTHSDQLDPYLEYIYTRLVRSSTDSKPNPNNLINLFITVVEYFGHPERVHHTLKQYLYALDENLRSIFSFNNSDESSKGRWRRERINDVVSAIALWIMEEDFHGRFGNQSIRATFFSRADAGLEGYSHLALNDDQLDHDGNFTIWSIADVMGLLPTLEPWVDAPSADPHEEVFQSRLNARLINRIGQVRFRWTFNFSEHMQLRNNELYIFCMPCRQLLEPNLVETNTPDAALDSIGFRRERGKEILKSYYLLFGPLNKSLIKELLASPHLPSPHDNLLEEYCERNAAGRAAENLARWSKQEFQYLWPSIRYLEHFLRDIEPDKFIKLIYRDRRNSYAYLTFLFAFIVLVLTLISTVFTVIQALKAFYPSGAAAPIVIVTMNAQPAATGATTTPSPTTVGGSSTRHDTTTKREPTATTAAHTSQQSTPVFQLASSCLSDFSVYCEPLDSSYSRCENSLPGYSTDSTQLGALSRCYCTDTSMLSLASRCDYDYRKTCEGAGSVSRLDQVFLFELCSVIWSGTGLISSPAHVPATITSTPMSSTISGSGSSGASASAESTKGTSLSAGGIAGIVVGAVTAAFLIMALTFSLIRRRRRVRVRSKSNTQQTFMSEPI